jgi:transcriptional regulator with XRE-family HTH domain
MSKEVLLEKLTDANYREAFISEEIDIGLPMQLRAMREDRGWNQKYVAEKMETRQPRFSVMERPGYGNFSLNTLKRLAAIFNVGLIVSFVPFSEVIEFTSSFSRKRLAIPSFADEYPRLEKRYGKGITQAKDAIQPSFDFSAGTSFGIVSSSTAGNSNISTHFLTTSRTPIREVVDIPVENLFMHSENGGNTYAAADIDSRKTDYTGNACDKY